MQKIKSFIKSFFYAKGKPKPVYFWSSIFLSLIATMIVLKLSGSVIKISDSLILGMMGFVSVLIGLYTWSKKNE